jgi:hypothetical protein
VEITAILDLKVESKAPLTEVNGPFWEASEDEVCRFWHDDRTGGNMWSC